MNGVERVEYGVEVTWPNGTVEVWASGLSRARHRLKWHNTPGNSNCSARLVQRTVIRTDWEPSE